MESDQTYKATDEDLPALFSQPDRRTEARRRILELAAEMFSAEQYETIVLLLTALEQEHGQSTK